MDSKTCCKCNIKQDISNFYVDNYRKDGHNIYCKKCIRLRDEVRKDHLSIYNKNYRELNKDAIKQQQAEYYKNNIDKLRAKAIAYRKNNKEKKNLQDKKYRKKRMAEDDIYKLSVYLRSVVGSSIKRHGYTKKSQTYNILGCDWEFFKSYIEGMFTKEMSWNNRSEWDIDHIIPLREANTERDLLHLWHYSNLRPLLRYDNKKKGGNRPDNDYQFRVL